MGTVSILRPEPDRPSSWTRFKENIANLIVEALLLLKMRTDLVRDEDDLTKLLFLCIIDANRYFDLPAWDAKNSPHISDKRSEKRENKRPDLSWNLMNHVGNHENLYRNFALECKRLGEKTSETWILNKQYVIEGVLRFFLEEKGYGKGCETGAMIGYVQDMEFDEILNEINFHIGINASSIPKLTMPAEGWQYQEVSRLNHTLQRPYIPFDFYLQHFWIDMRNCQFLPSKIENIPAMSNYDSSEQATKKGQRKSKKGPTPKKQSQLELPMENPAEPSEATSLSGN